MQRFSKVIKHLSRPWRSDIQTQRSIHPHRHMGAHTSASRKARGHTHTRAHTQTRAHTHGHARTHTDTRAHTRRHLKANADTQTLVHCSLKLSLCVDFSGLLTLVWGQRRCPRFFYAMQQVFWGKDRSIQHISWKQ